MYECMNTLLLLYEMARDENGKIKFSASWVSPEVFEAAISSYSEVKVK